MINKEELDEIIENQKHLQRVHGFPIDSFRSEDRDRMSEIYIYKAIEELIELRRTQPSSLIPMSKNQPVIDRRTMLKEFSDVFLYLINFAIARNISSDEFFEVLREVQGNNLVKALEKSKTQI